MKVNSRLTFLCDNETTLGVTITPPLTRQEEKVVYDAIRLKDPDGSADSLRVVLDDLLRALGKTAEFWQHVGPVHFF